MYENMLPAVTCCKNVKITVGVWGGFCWPLGYSETRQREAQWKDCWAKALGPSKVPQPGSQASWVLTLLPLQSHSLSSTLLQPNWTSCLHAFYLQALVHMAFSLQNAPFPYEINFGSEDTTYINIYFPGLKFSDRASYWKAIKSS